MTTAETLQAEKAAQTGKRLFKSPQPSWKFIFPDGVVANFVRGEYITDDEGQIAHLEMEIRKGHPLMFIDPKEIYVSPERLDPLIGLRARIREEERARIMEEMARATNPANNFGNSDQGKFNPQSTTDIAPVTIGQKSTAARLTELVSAPTKTSK